MSHAELVVLASQVLHREGLVDAFGHASMREGDDAMITPPRPLRAITEESLERLPLGELAELPGAVPKEAWIHHAIYCHRPDVGAVCRAQPPATLAVGAVTDALPATHGQGALVGAPVPVFDDARLVRDAGRAEEVARVLGDGWALILRGNGAVTAGHTLGQAVARMALLERSARVFLAARAAGPIRPLGPEEVAFWQATADELLDRYWAHLRA